VQPAIAEPNPLMRQFTKLFAKFRIISAARAIAYARAISRNHPARPPLAEIKQGLKVRHRFTPCSRRHHFLIADRWLRRPSGQACIVQHRVSQKLLELRVLRLQRPKPLRLGNFKTTILGLPVVKRSLRDTMLARQISLLRACFSLTQNTDNLFFCK